MGESLKDRPIAVAISVFSGAFTVASLLNDAYDIINLGLPNMAWAAIGAGTCIVSLMAILIKQDQAIKRQNQSIEQQHQAIKLLKEAAPVAASLAAELVVPQRPAEQQLPKGPPKLLKEHRASLLSERETLVARRSTYLDRRSELQSDLPKQYISSQREAITQRIDDISRDLAATSERIAEIDDMLKGG